MSKMYEALQNPHYKKIWEKVIMNRHPEAQSLEEALGLEISPFNGCMVLVDLTKLGYTMSINEPLKVVSYNRLEYFAIEPVYSKRIAVWDSYNKKIKNNTQILGRPITLEDILIITKEYKFRKCDIDGTNQIKFFKTQTDLKYLGFDWQLTKPLHEQTHETWETMANLIN